MKTQQKPYYVGLDLGTNSIGWAVTDEAYHLQKFKGMDMWGARLFAEAETAANRRMARIARRRTQRSKKRLALLQELFAEEIAKVDDTFFMRLKESKYHPEDKMTEGRFALFNDPSFTDADYFDQFPTIYHLRSELTHSKEAHDPRLVYLAIHHIIKNRGHFLFEGQSLQNVKDFGLVYARFAQFIEERFELPIPPEHRAGMEAILRDESLTLTDRKSRLNKLFDTKDKQFKEILSVLAGGKGKLAVLFANDALAKSEKPTIEFKKGVYEDDRDEYESILNEDILFLDILKSVYDWSVLSSVLGEHTYLSDAKVELFERHGEDLRTLKALVRRYGKPGTNGGANKKAWSDVFRHFRSENETGNYTAYVGVTQYDHAKRQVADKRCNQEDINVYFKKVLAAYHVAPEDQAAYDAIMARLEAKEALPKLRQRDNGVIPYQVHQMELEAILANAATYLPFLAEKDAQGLSVADKIQKIQTFRIPYYVGPLNNAHSEDRLGGGQAWIVRKEEGRILPWNFDEKVDREASAERFIRRMTNKCTYLVGCDVIPNDSLLYSRFKILNELNNLRIDGKPLEPAFKQKLFNDLFKTNKRVTNRKLRTYLKKHNFGAEGEPIITGIDGDFKSSYASYLIFREIFGAKIDDERWQAIAEDLILWKCLYGEDIAIYRKKIEAVYGDVLSAEEIKKTLRKRFTGWGRFSKEFLTEIQGVDRESGELVGSIMDALENGQDNLMQLLSSRYTFKEAIDRYNDTGEVIERITYENVFKDSYLSPAIKRTVWQTIQLLEEIRKIQKALPKRIYLEMTRAEGAKERKSSRKSDLLKLYKACKNDVLQWLIDDLESREEASLRSKKLYLYFTQQGRCMYTGKIIPIDSLMRGSHTYDIDHIYPRSLTKDDSMDNLVLVDRTVNAKKSDSLMLSDDIRAEQTPFWAVLRKQGFISERKFARLTRATELSTEELAGFVNRQLVETSQATKAVADTLKKFYPDVDMVYVKAKTVSDLRRQADLLKVREVNVCHHAHDAFLNIVAGDVYHQKFTRNPYIFIQKERQRTKRPYNLDKFFTRQVKVGERIVWDPDIHMAMLRKTLARRTVRVTEMPYEQRGALYNATHIRKSTSLPSSWYP